VIFDRGANRQSPSRQVRIPVRDAAGALLGFVDVSAARSAVHRGQAFWRGHGSRRYIVLGLTASRGGWMMPPSTESEQMPGRLFGRPRRHSQAPSWQTAPTSPSTLLRASDGGCGNTPATAAGIFEEAPL
jgi:hypothetical protein